MVRASLIVLNYNGEDVIDGCLRSLTAAMGRDDQLIVVDNGSGDRSRSIIASHELARPVLLPENTFIFGLNAGLEVATGEFVAFLNNDMTVDRNFVDYALKEFTSDDTFAVCPRILQTTGAEQGSRTRGIWHRGLIFYESLPHVDIATDCFFAVGGQSFFRRAMLDEIGSIDPLLWPMYHEDIELSYRAWKRGWQIRYAPDAIAHHLGGHTSSKVFTPVELRSFVRQNEILTVWKDITDRRLLAEHLALLPVRVIGAILRRDRGELSGTARALRRLPGALRARRRAQRHFVISDAEVLRRISSVV